MRTINLTFFLTLTFFFLGQVAFSQKLMNSFGATISVLKGGDVTLAQTSFSYFPRLNIMERENSSISIGAPVAVGIGLARNTYGDDAGISFTYDLPIVVDYNIGCKSTKENERNFGGYFGLGFGYYKVSISQSTYSNFTGATYGPIFRAGVRFGSSNENWHGHAVTIGLFFKNGLEAAKLKTFGFNILYDL